MRRILFLLKFWVLTGALATTCTGNSRGGEDGPVLSASEPADGEIQGTCAAPHNRLQYVVSIRRQGTRDHVCTGTLVDESHVLTAAHCVEPDSPYSAGPRAIVHIGVTSIDQVDEGIEVVMAEKTVFHEDWPANKTQRSPFNVALMTLSQPSQHASPTLLHDHFELSTGHQLMAAGWGPGGDGPSLGGNIFDTLKLEPQEFISGERCSRESLWGSDLDNKMICGLNRGRKSSCVVDSGSPLLLLDSPGHRVSSGTPSLDFFVGMNVDGAPCGTEGKPDVYVDMRVHAQWLKAKLKSRKLEL